MLEGLVMNVGGEMDTTLTLSKITDASPELISRGLAKLPPLTPGDFGAVQRRLCALGEQVELERMFRLLAAEALERGRPERAAGFVAAVG